MPETEHHHHSHDSNSHDEKHSKFAPTITQLIQTAAKLPHPQKASETTFDAFVMGETGRTITFDLIKIVDSDGIKTYKWTYKGRIIIESKYHKTLAQSEDED